MSPVELPEGLAKILTALLHDKALRRWFESLAIETPTTRAMEFRKTAARMGDDSAHSELKHAIGLLAAPGMYEALLEALEHLEP